MKTSSATFRVTVKKIDESKIASLPELVYDVTLPIDIDSYKRNASDEALYKAQALTDAEIKIMKHLKGFYLVQRIELLSS